MVKKIRHPAAIIRHAAARGKGPGKWRLALGLAAAAAVIQLFAVAFHQGAVHREQTVLRALDRAMVAQGATLAQLRRENQAQIDLLAAQLARLQSYITRLDALGGTLVELAQLEDGAEFGFGSEPGLGGRGVPLDGAAPSATELGVRFDRLARQIEDRSLWLDILEDVIQERELISEVHPSSWPVRAGWISSRYGWRKDPFHGRSAFHKGVDFATEHGAGILAAAAGIVEFAGRRDGYGLMVQVRHGNGYQTRYGHVAKLLVEPGQMVERGAQLARVGSTGRSTGPHLHFEVLKDGEAVDPLKFLSARR